MTLDSTLNWFLRTALDFAKITVPVDAVAEWYWAKLGFPENGYYPDENLIVALFEAFARCCPQQYGPTTPFYRRAMRAVYPNQSAPALELEQNALALEPDEETGGTMSLPSDIDLDQQMLRTAIPFVRIRFRLYWLRLDMKLAIYQDLVI
jgi:hypothetical protein